MNAKTRDPLLAAARLLLMVFIAVLSFAAAVVAIALPFLVIFQDRVITRIAEEGVTIGPEMIGAIALVMIGVVGLLALGIYFLVLLRRIVLSVGIGDPFVPDNADRLSRMGWVTLIGQIASLLVGLLVVWIGETIGEQAENMHLVTAENFDIDLSGLLLMLVLFILARVFRRGAEMREELEGTV